MGTSANVKSHFISCNFDLDYYEKKEFKRIIKNIIYDAIDEKGFDFTRENYIEEKLESKFKGSWYVKIYDEKEYYEKNIGSYESDTAIYYHLIDEGGLLSDAKGEYFYIKKKSGSDCFIF